MSILLTNRIKEKIENANTTVAELERKARLPQGTLRKIIIGNTKNPGIETIWAVAQALNCRLEYLIEGDSSFEEETPSLDANSDFIPSLYADCVTYSVNYFVEKKSRLDLLEALEIIKEIYLYSYNKEGQQLDRKFAQWILNKKIKF